MDNQQLESNGAYLKNDVVYDSQIFKDISKGKSIVDRMKKIDSGKIITITRTQKTKVSLNAVAIAMTELARIRNRPDGYPLETVKMIKDAINNETPHPLKSLVEKIIEGSSSTTTK
jgi:hypothetical protein